MFNTIILLAEPAEQPVLATLLRRHNPKLAVRAVASIEEIDALKAGTADARETGRICDAGRGAEADSRCAGVRRL
jgi:hypothetical protein